MSFHNFVMAVLPFCFSLCLISCGEPARSGILIDRYRHSTCVQPIYDKRFDEPTRGWDAEIALNSGIEVRVKGFGSASAIISVQYLPNGYELKAIIPDDYIYPTDVRVDFAHGLLYVRADGSAAGIWDQTLLYEYDLLNKKVTSKMQVDPSVLPSICPM